MLHSLSLRETVGVVHTSHPHYRSRVCNHHLCADAHIHAKHWAPYSCQRSHNGWMCTHYSHREACNYVLLLRFFNSRSDGPWSIPECRAPRVNKESCGRRSAPCLGFDVTRPTDSYRQFSEHVRSATCHLRRVNALDPACRIDPLHLLCLAFSPATRGAKCVLDAWNVYTCSRGRKNRGCCREIHVDCSRV